MLTVGSVCSGYGGAELAFQNLASPVFMSEIEPFPRAILQQRFPHVPLYGDFTEMIPQPPPCDILTGGTPCQAFSLAGRRKSLDDARGNLTLAFVMLFDALDDLRAASGLPPAACLWENVPGVLSVKDNAFGCFLAALVGRTEPFVSGRRNGRWPQAGFVLGPRRCAAWRVCDAQYYGVPQRRRRVFVVASAREGFNPGEVLFERQGVPRHSSSRRKAKKEDTIRTLGSPSRGWRIGAEEAAAGQLIALTVSLRGRDGGSIAELGDGVACALKGSEGGGSKPYVLATMAYGGNNTSCPIDVATTTRNACASPSGRLDFETETFCVTGQVTHALTAEGFDASEDGSGRGTPLIACRARVRRLMPVECERLQGLPDNWTLVPYRNKPAEKCPDGPRYKAIGNGWAIPCVRPIAAGLVTEMLFA